MALNRIMSIKKSNEILQGREDYQNLLKQNDSSIALALLASIGTRIALHRISASWVNHLGNRIESSLLVCAIDLALSKLSYQDTIECFFYLIDEKTMAAMGMILLKRIAQDMNFFENLKIDDKLAPILFHYYPDIAEMMDPALVKPLSASSREYLKAEKISLLKFDKNTLTIHQKDILAIHDLLTDKEKMLRQLACLDQALSKKIQERNQDAQLPLSPLQGKDHRLFKKPYAKIKDKPLLFGFFQEWAIANGFGDVIRLTNVKSDEDFIKNLKDGLLFKDPAVGGTSHGAWTHLIQWYCITNAYHTREIILNESPSDIYKTMGMTANKENFIWEKTFETPLAIFRFNPADFTDVENFNNFINHDPLFAKQCPTLQAMICYRNLKDEYTLKNRNTKT